MDNFRKFDQLTTGCWLFNQPSYRMRSQKRLNSVILDGYAISVEGVYTQHDPTKTRKQKPRYKSGKKIIPVKPREVDIFDFSQVTLVVNAQFIKGEFIKMKETKEHFYINSDDISSMITLTRIRFSTKEDLSPLYDLNGEPIKSEDYVSYTFCVNTVFPDLEMMAAKLVSD